MYTATRFLLACLSLAPGFAAAQFAITSSANPAQLGVPITFTVQDVTGYTNSWATPPDEVTAQATDLTSLAVITLGFANIITKSKYQLTTNSLPAGRYSIRFVIVRGTPLTGGTIDNSDTLDQIVAPNGVVPQAIPAMSSPTLLALVGVFLVAVSYIRTRWN